VSKNNVKSRLSGYDIHIKDDTWVFSDTLEPTASSYKKRPCGECGLYRGDNDHDPCISDLPKVLNACCGHGDTEDAYVMMEDRECFYGEDAVKIINNLKKNRRMQETRDRILSKYPEDVDEHSVKLIMKHKFKNTPVIFLDIDGVLNSVQGHQRIEDYEVLNGNYDENSIEDIIHCKNDLNGEICLGSWVERWLVNNLKILIQHTNAEVVGVSSWFTSRHSLETVSDFLGIEIVDMTDYTGGGLERGRSVERYVDKYGIKDYCILDDSHEQHYEGKLLNEKLVRVDGGFGLSFYDINWARYILKGD